MRSSSAAPSAANLRPPSHSCPSPQCGVGVRVYCVVCVCIVWCVFACQGAGNAAATSPARGGGRLAASSPRSAIARLPSGASPSPCIPPPRAGSASGGGIPRPAHSVSAEPECGRRCGAPPAPADSVGAPRPHAARSAVARLGRNTSQRRIGGISLASVRVSRRHRLRLVSPPLQPLRAFLAPPLR